MPIGGAVAAEVGEGRRRAGGCGPARCRGRCRRRAAARPRRRAAGGGAATASSCRPSAGRRGRAATGASADAGAQQLGDRVEQREPLGVGIGPHGAGAARQQLGQLGHDPGAARRRRAPPASRVGAERRAERAQRLDERLERRGEVLVAAAVEHDAARGVGAWRRARPPSRDLPTPGSPPTNTAPRVRRRPRRSQSRSSWRELVAAADERTRAGQRGGSRRHERAPTSRRRRGRVGSAAGAGRSCVDVLAARQAAQVAVAEVARARRRRGGGRGRARRPPGTAAPGRRRRATRSRAARLSAGPK